jgi:hypothetical protein
VSFTLDESYNMDRTTGSAKLEERKVSDGR